MIGIGIAIGTATAIECCRPNGGLNPLSYSPPRMQLPPGEFPEAPVYARSREPAAPARVRALQLLRFAANRAESVRTFVNIRARP